VICRSDGVPPLPARGHYIAVDPDTGAELRYEGALEPHVVLLTSEGFNRYTAAKALQLSKNDANLARLILKEFKPR